MELRVIHRDWLDWYNWWNNWVCCFNGVIKLPTNLKRKMLCRCPWFRMLSHKSTQRSREPLLHFLFLGCKIVAIALINALHTALPQQMAEKTGFCYGKQSTTWLAYSSSQYFFNYVLVFDFLLQCHQMFVA